MLLRIIIVQTSLIATVFMEISAECVRKWFTPLPWKDVRKYVRKKFYVGLEDVLTRYKLLKMSLTPAPIKQTCEVWKFTPASLPYSFTLLAYNHSPIWHTKLALNLINNDKYVNYGGDCLKYSLISEEKYSCVECGFHMELLIQNYWKKLFQK